jgi:predicted phosphodiesterase
MRILLVGDTHGNERWWNNYISPAAEALAVDAICQVGDFGYWRGSEDFLQAVGSSGVPVYFLDGNHEHHWYLNTEVAAARTRNGTGVGEPVALTSGLTFLPRGVRVDWDGVCVAACGGAASIDRRWRKTGVDWFPEELITDTDVAAFTSTGTVDVLLTHDAPMSAPVPLAPRNTLSPAWLEELPTCDKNRLVLEDVVDAAQPKILIHGHYHVAWTGDVTRPWGTYRAVGLAEDGTGTANLALLTCKDGTATVSNVAAYDA